MLHIDGAMGEGGGQVLRTALGLSLVTGQPFLIERIRAGRKRPGLQRQHLTSVMAAAQVGGARIEGAELGSQRLCFRPGRVRAGDYRVAIGTAGSTTLVLQTILPALFGADGPSTVELSGGTHNQMAPPFDFLQQAFAPHLHRMGVGLALTLERHGFYPAGGGQWRAVVAPAAWQPLSLTERGALRPLKARILIAQLPSHVADREARELRTILPLGADAISIEEVPSDGPGNVVMVFVPSAAGTEVVTAFGERGVPAEAVAAAAAAEAQGFLRAEVPVGEHLADQLLIPLALAGGGEFRTVTPSLHTRTNAEVIERFLPVRFELREDGGRPGSWIVALRRER
jgi:RNA 3'-terminal phosphate cyclase (ATP)